MPVDYPTVLKRSKNRRLLEAVYGIVITEEAADQVVFDYLDECEIKEVRYTGTSGRGKCEYRGDYVCLMLPSEKTGKLTLGIMLHELAHAINYKDFGGKAHDDTFVKVLDDLVMSEWMWKSGRMDE